MDFQWRTETRFRLKAVHLWTSLATVMFLSLSPLCGAAENPPSIGGIADQVTLKNQSVTVEFTVSDQETAAADLSLSGSSADTDLVPNANILFGGSGGNRSATVIPETDQTGTVVITITVEDEDSQTASTTFNLRVNSRPTIAAISNQQTDEDTAKEVGLEIDDAETAVEGLTLSWSASDPGLIADITFNINSSDQSLTIDPTADQNGETDITVTVDDGDHSASETFALEILPVNDAPVISGSLAGAGSRDPIPDKGATPIFDQITIDDIDQDRPDDENITVEVTLLPQGQEGANDPHFENQGTQFQLTGTPDEVQQALRGVNFDPAENVRAVGDLDVYDVLINPSGGVPSGGDLGDFQIVIQVQDQDELEAVIEADLQEEMTLEIESINDAPVVVVDTVTAITDSETDVRPFQISVSDPDPLETFAGISIELVDSGDSTYGGFDPANPELTGGNLTAGALEDFVRNQVAFVPVQNSVATSASIEVRFRVEDRNSGAGTATATLTLEGINDQPNILGVPGEIIRITDDQSAFPFETVRIEDPDGGGTQEVSLTVSVDDPDLGSWGLPGDSPLVSDGGGLQTQESVSLTPEQATEAIRSAEFQPALDEIPIGETATVSITLVVTDALDESRPSNPIRVAITSVNGAPVIVGVPDPEDQPKLVAPPEPVNPFAATESVPAVAFDDDDDNITVEISIDDPEKGTLWAPESEPVDIEDYQASDSDRAVVVSTGHGLETGDSIRIAGYGGDPAYNDIHEVTILDQDTFSLPVGFTDNATPKGGWVRVGMAGETFAFTGTVEDAANAVQALIYDVNDDHVFPPEAPGGTTFEIKAVDSILNTRIEQLSIVLGQEPRNWLVTRTGDDPEEPGTLRYVLGRATNNDVITFALNEYPAVIRLNDQRGPLVLDRHVSLKGPGADKLTISGDTDGDGQPDVRLFEVNATAVMEGLRLTRGGGATSGGALFVGETGHLILSYCEISESRATQWGGAIDVSQGRLQIWNSLILNNAVDESLGLGGGAISIYSDEPCSFVNTTFSGNRQRSANGFGGGALYVENFTPSTELPVKVVHSTFADNRDAADNGSSIHANVFGATVRVRNSIFADGRDRNLWVQGAGRIVSEGGNLSDDTTRVTLTQGGTPLAIRLLDHTSDEIDTDVDLQKPLSHTVGPTATYALQSGSPARGAAVTPFEFIDQRGVLRTSRPDAGAFEAGPTPRLVINEIQTQDTPADFIELYVPRNSPPVDLNGLTLWVNGELRHVFSLSTNVPPGFGVVVADNSISASDTTVQTPSESSELGLTERGLVEIRTTGQAAAPPILRAGYVDVFADETLSVEDHSLTLAPQFVGAAYLPHGLVLAPPNGFDRNKTGGLSHSPGADSAGTAFGADNAPPIASLDELTVDEDERVQVRVLENDSDADGLDRLVIVDVSETTDQGTGDQSMASSSMGAAVTILPDDVPLRGGRILYDPTSTMSLQQLPEGAEVTDTFYYEIQDIGTGPIVSYQDAGADGVRIESPAHRLDAGDVIVISGADAAEYNGEHIVASSDKDTFTITVSFVGDPEAKGSWGTKEPRSNRADNDKSEALVSIQLLGANDSPEPVADQFATPEETPLRIMGDPELAGSTTKFNSDETFETPPVIAGVSLLENDGDPDTDDDSSRLHAVGVLGTVNPIGNFVGEPGQSPVEVQAPGHGLTDGDRVLIAGYGGHRSYNGFHSVTVLNADTFTLPVEFVDNAVAKGVWTMLDDSSRLLATSERGATVNLELRKDRIETSVVYNPLTSDYLDGLAEGETAHDTFYYAVEDSHGAINIAQITVEVTGVNDSPVPQNDPGALTVLDPLLDDADLAALLSELDVRYYLPSASGGINRVDARVQTDEGESGDAPAFTIADLWKTAEEAPLKIPWNELLNNDSDVDRNDVLEIRLVNGSNISRAGAELEVDTAGQTVLYDPRTSSELNRLARGEPRLDSFEVTIADPHMGEVDSLVSVLVVGSNDTPAAEDDQRMTFEDQLLELTPPGVLENDVESDINQVPPDNRLALVPVSDAPTEAPGALVNIAGSTLTYDPRPSGFLDGLALGQTFVDSYEYLVMDGSFIFANDDQFKVTADGSDFVLNLLANDQNLAGTGTGLRILEVGTPSQGGTVSIHASEAAVVYSPEVNFVGDDVFTYSVVDQEGNRDRGLVIVQVTVNQLNGNLQANADHFSVAKGQAPVLDVLANDNILPEEGGALTITELVATPSNDQVSLVDNQIVYEQQATGPYPYTQTFRYEISGGGTARAVAEVTVEVTNREGTLNIRDDTYSVLVESSENVLDVLANDNLLPGDGAPLIVQSVGEPGHGDVRTGDNDNGLIYTPDAGFVGQDSFTYTASDELGGTGTGLVTVSVGRLITNNDLFTLAKDESDSNAAIALDVLANDRVIRNPSGGVEIVDISPEDTSLGTMSIGADFDRLEFDPAQNQTGEQTYSYTIEDRDGTGNQAVGEVTVVVVEGDIHANRDVFTVATDSTDNPLDVLGNDATDAGEALTVVEVPGGIHGPDQGGSVKVNESGDRLIYTPAPGFSGEETFTYTMTDSRKTDTARVVVKVTSGDLTANDDTFTVFFELLPGEGNPPREFTLPVLLNDRVLPDFGQTLTLTGVGIDDTNANNAPDQEGDVEISPDGTALIYTPKAEGTERFTYEITDGTTRRAEAKVTVEVQQRENVRDMETHDDAFTVGRDSTNNRLAVLANDHVKPAEAAGWTITQISSPSHDGIVAVAGPVIRYTPQPGFVGTDTFEYFVSDGFGGTGKAEVSVKVGDLPLSADRFAATSASADLELDVLANDQIRPETAEAFQLLHADGADRGGIVEVGADEEGHPVILYTPDPNYAGDYPYEETFQYRVEDDSGGTVSADAVVSVYRQGSDRDSGTLSVTVNGVNDAPTIAGSGPAPSITDKQTVQPFTDVTIADVDDQGEEELLVMVRLDDPAKGIMTDASLGASGFMNVGSGVYSFVGNGAAATEAIRQLVFDPTENRITVPTSELTTFTLSADDQIVAEPVTDSATTVQVTAVNDPPVISGTRSGQKVYHRGSLKPFASVTIGEVDDLKLQPLTVTVSFDPEHGSLPGGGGFSGGNNGEATFHGTAAEATAAIRELVFRPETEGRLGADLDPPPASEETIFTIAVDDGFAPPVVDSNTSVIAYHGLIGKLLASDGNSGDEFGSTVAAGRNLVVIGAPENNDSGSDSGSVYVYARNQGGPGEWGEIAKLVAPDASSNDQFGYAVALDDETIVVGAPFARIGGRDSGAVYVFEPSQPGAQDWQGHVTKLVPSDGDRDDEFGFAVSISGGTILVGAPDDNARGNDSGSFYVYERQSAGNWTETVTGRAPNDLSSGDELGHSVAIYGDSILVGAPYADDQGGESGLAYLFQRDANGQWLEVKKLLALDGSSGDQFGFSVSIHRDVALVGSPLDDGGSDNSPSSSGNDRGSAYLYGRHQDGQENWGQITKLSPAESLNNDQFGFSVAAGRGLVAAGMPFSGDDNQSRFGSAFAYGSNPVSAGDWELFEKLDPPDSQNNDEFGIAVSLKGGVAVVGARADDDLGRQSGSAYLYELQFNNAPAVATPIPDQVAVQGETFTLTVPEGTFGDADVGDELTFSAALEGGGPLPAWLSFAPAGPTFTGVPSASDLGTIEVRLTAVDLGKESATLSFAIEVVLSSSQLSLQAQHDSTPQDYDGWAGQQFSWQTLNDSNLEASTWGRNADPDRDGQSNLEEYAFGTNPLAIAMDEEGPLSVERTPAGLLISFTRRTNDSGLVFVIESSDDLVNWNRVESLSGETVTNLDAEYERVSYQLPDSAEGLSQFIRVKLDHQ